MVADCWRSAYSRLGSSPASEGGCKTELRVTGDPSARPETLAEPEFVQELFSWLAPRYEQALLLYSLGLDLRWKHVLLAPLRPQRGERALDLASGTGLILDRLGRRLGRRAVVGLDPNRAMLLAQDHRLGAAPLVQATAEALPFHSSSFDLVTAGFLPKYVRLDRFASEVHRVLRPGGRLAVYDFSPPTPDVSGRLYAVYLDRVLPWLGRRRDRTSPMWSRLLEFLRDIARESGWEERIGPALQAAGFDRIRHRVAVGGAVTWVWAIATKRSTPPPPA